MRRKVEVLALVVVVFLLGYSLVISFDEHIKITGFAIEDVNPDLVQESLGYMVRNSALSDFLAEGSIYQIYAKHVSQSELFGFIEVEDLLFDHGRGVVVDPSEEKLRSEFAGVERFYVPNHAVLRIDAVAKEGVAKIVDAKGLAPSNISPFPLYQPPKPASKE